MDAVFERGLLRYFPVDYLKRIAGITIGIAGCGGIGSNCAHNLVRCGFRKFLLVDHDSVAPSNLNRQFFFRNQIGASKVGMLEKNLLAVNPGLDIQVLEQELLPLNMAETFKECDVIVEGFDEPVSKKQLVEACLHPDKLVVAVSGIAGTGNTDAIITRKVSPGFYIVGDFSSGVSEICHPYAPGVTIAAAKQADVVLNHFLQV